MNTKRSGINNKTKMYIQGYAMIAPQIIGFLVFSLYPILWAAHKAFYFYTGAPSQTRLVGLDNFIKIFTTDTTYWNTWITTIKFTIMKMPIELTLAMILAIILTKKLKGKGFFRALYYMPSVISIAIVGLIVTSMFDYFGFINGWLMKVGLIKHEIEWFANPGSALLALVIGSVWSTFGVNVMYFIAAMSNVPEELYESAKLDGASAKTIFFKITLPSIMPVFATIILLSLNGTLHVSDYILVTTNGAPGGATFSVMSYIVSKFVPGFAEGVVNIGYGCAISVVTSIIMMLIAIGYSKLSNKLQS